MRRTYVLFVCLIGTIVPKSDSRADVIQYEFQSYAAPIPFVGSSELANTGPLTLGDSGILLVGGVGTAVFSLPPAPPEQEFAYTNVDGSFTVRVYLDDQTVSGAGFTWNPASTLYIQYTGHLTGEIGGASVHGDGDLYFSATTAELVNWSPGTGIGLGFLQQYLDPKSLQEDAHTRLYYSGSNDEFFGYDIDLIPQPIPVPEPSTYVVFLGAVAGAGLWRRRCKRFYAQRSPKFGSGDLACHAHKIMS